MKAITDTHTNAYQVQRIHKRPWSLIGAYCVYTLIKHVQDLINPGNSHSGILFIMHLSVAIAIAWGPLQMVKKLKLKLFSACILLRSMHAVLLGIQAMIQDMAH